MKQIVVTNTQDAPRRSAAARWRQEGRQPPGAAQRYVAIAPVTICTVV